MLFFFTSLTDFLGMAVSLWLAAYLLARGFPSRITFRAVVVMVSLTAFFLSAYLNLYHPTAGSGVWRAACVTVGFLAWYDLTYRLLPASLQKKLRWMVWGISVLSVVGVGLLFALTDILADPPYPLYVTRVHLGLGYVAYGVCVGALMLATLYNFLWIARTGAGPHHRYFLTATLLAAGVTFAGYGITALPMMPPVPRLFQDGLFLATVSVLGYAVARHQAFVERRTTLQDFPISGLAILGLSGLYTLVAWQRGFAAEAIAFITLLAVLTHSTYDLAREFLDRLLHRRESALRRQLRQLARDVGGDSTLQSSLQEGLTNLCLTLNASSGFIATRSGQSEQFVVSASFFSLTMGSAVEKAQVTCDDVCQPNSDLGEKAAWLAPAFVGKEQRGVLGIGPRATRTQYAETDLDLLADMADWLGRMIATYTQQQEKRDDMLKLATEVQVRELDLQAEAESLLATRENDPDQEFVRLVEDALRHLPDYTNLGQSPLAEQLEIRGATHIERGKALREQLVQAIEALRPATERPAGVLPREWQSYVVLYDAYIEDAPNREIMARLYISEGTFNRMRRKALRAVARSLWETKIYPHPMAS